MVEQYRHGTKNATLEFPAGILEDSDKKEQVKRELLEETGFAANDIDIIYVKSVNIDASRTNKSDSIFIARKLVRESEQKLEATENINVRLVEFDDLQKLIENDIINEATMVTAALLALQNKDWFLGK